MDTYQNWRLQYDEDRILWLTLDCRDSTVNVINQDVLNEFTAILKNISEDPATKGLVILSGKKKGFIAGADIKKFALTTTREEAFELIRQGQLVFNQLEALSIPTCAMINGFALGGGLELALACRYRVALEHPDTHIGLPEVKLGLHPGWGGTIRLPRLIGAFQAMDLMLTGKSVSAVEAAEMGIVDAAVPERHLDKAARFYILERPKCHKPKGLEKWTNLPLIRSALGAYFRRKLAEKVNAAYYPAPYAIIKNWELNGVNDPKAMLNEAYSIAELMVGETSRQLVRVFFLQDQLKALAKNKTFKPQHIHVIGAGMMGGDIAAWCAYKGFTVTLQDQSPERIAPAIKRAYELLVKKHLSPRLIQATLDRLYPDINGLGVKHADVVIEAVFEDLAVKQELFKSIEPHTKPNALLATNTSSIPLEEIAAILQNPARLIGLHFFNPVAKMPLVEIVQSVLNTSEQIQAAASFVNLLGHYPLPVASRPGFLVNRILMPYIMEALIMYEENIPPEKIDQAAKEFGMPMGPIALCDAVGLDICLSVAKSLAEHFPAEIPECLIDKVEEGHLGVKTGRGFYTYKNGQPVLSNTETKIPLPEICERLILRLCNESVACLGEKIVSNADWLDAGMIFGIGFPPFRGGPMEYIRHCGAQTEKEKLLHFSKQFGDRFKPYPEWDALI